MTEACKLCPHPNECAFLKCDCACHVPAAVRAEIEAWRNKTVELEALVAELRAQFGQAATQRPAVVAKTVYGYSGDEDAERWSGMCSTREKAIEEARSEFGDVPYFYVMEGTVSPASAYVPDANWIVEQMAETAAGEGGEASEDFPEVSDEAKKELDTLLEAWADKNIVTNFWVADGVAERIEDD